MADSSALAELLDRAGKVFSLAGELGRAFHEQGQTRAIFFDPSLWQQHAPTFKQFCDAVLDLRGAMQNPPDGFAPVAKPLLEAARIAKGIRDTLASERGFTAYLDFFPDLNTVCQAGYEAVKGVTKARRLDDPFAFVDDVALSKSFTLLDRFPATPEGHLEFLQFVGNELCLAADAKRQQVARGYSNDTLASMVRGIKWSEARARAKALTTAYPEPASRLADVLALDLSVATVAELDEQYGPAISALWKAIHKPAKPATPAELEVTPDGKIRIADWAVAQHGILLDEIMLGPRPGIGNRFPISDFDAIVVDGDTPSICPKTDRPIPAEWLPTILEVFNRMKLVKPGQTIHWVGGQAKLENVCTCYREGFPSPDAVPTGNGDLIERLLAGPDDAELTPRELALLEAHLKQPLSLSTIQRERRSSPTGDSETCNRRNKLKLIRDFNRNLQGAAPAESEAEPVGDVGQGEPVEAASEPSPESPTGFLGGMALADALGVHPTQRDAFFQRLMRQRMSLGDDCWHEVRDPRPNSPRFLYRVDSPKLRDLAAGYKTPKPA